MPPYDSLPEISPFHEVEVWCTFTRRWVPGFWLDGLEPDGSIRLRRGIDQAPLSGPVPASSVRTRQSAPGRVIDLRQPDRVVDVRRQDRAGDLRPGHAVTPWSG